MEFLTSGDFDGDGTRDVLVFDKTTGNARIGFQTANGSLTWAGPFLTDVDDASALAVGRFWNTNREAIAVTSADLNRIHLLDFASSETPIPSVLIPAHAGTTLLVGLDDPYGAGASRSSLVVGASDPGMSLLDLYEFVADGQAAFQDQTAADGYLASASSFRRSATDATMLAAIRRGTQHDTFVVYSYWNGAVPVLERPDLRLGTEYIHGHFNQEPLPRLLFYVPGQSNIIVQPLVQTGAEIHFGMATLNTFSAPVQRIYYLKEQADGMVIIQFGDGIVNGLRPQAGTGQLDVTYRFGLGQTGNVITGVAPLGSGQFALLSGRSNAVVSAHAQVFTRQGSDYVQTSSSPLTDVTTGDRANLWLFQLEPFASSAAVMIGSMSAPAWSSQPSGLPASLAVRVESDSGAELGLGNPGTTSLGTPPPGTVYALPNQYRADISFFGYARPRAPEPAVVTISPPPGSYGGPILISFTRLNTAHEIYYRVAGESWQLYSSPFTLTQDASIQYYGNVPGGERGRLQFASYTLGVPSIPIEPAVTLPGSETNQPPVIDPNVIRISTSGTVFYSRRGNHHGASLWAIDLDGSRDTYITAGIQPRVSPNGRWMAFQRENDPALNQTSLWLRDLTTGVELRLRSSSDRFGGYDWYADSTGLIFDNECVFWHTEPAGPPMQLPLASHCRQHAPAINPVDDRIAFQMTPPGEAGLYLAPPDASAAQKIPLSVPSPRWPVWSPDGQHITFTDDPQNSPVLAAGKDLWILHLGVQTNLYQITGFTDIMDGFPYGAVWSPHGSALVGAGTVFGSKGIWILPLTPGRNACAEMPFRLPTLPGDVIELVGSVIVAPDLPELFIRGDGAWVVVFWHRTPFDFVLETAANPATTGWLPVAGPYVDSGVFFEHAIPESELSSASFYRLRRR